MSKMTLTKDEVGTEVHDLERGPATHLWGQVFTMVVMYPDPPRTVLPLFASAQPIRAEKGAG